MKLVLTDLDFLKNKASVLKMKAFGPKCVLYIFTSLRIFAACEF